MNMHIRSNVYPIESDTFTTIRKISQNSFSGKKKSIQDFLSQIRGKAALKSIARFVHCNSAREEETKKVLQNLGVKQWQIELYWNLDTPCAFAKPGHNPHGLIGKEKIGCRCQNITCRYFNKNINRCGV